MAVRSLRGFKGATVIKKSITKSLLFASHSILRPGNTANQSQASGSGFIEVV